MAIDLSQVVFEGKKLEDLVKEVYDNHKKQDKKLKSELTRLSEMITNPGDAIVIVPMLKGFFDSSLKNDETLMKLVQIFQKAADSKKDESDNGMLTEQDMAKLFEEVHTLTSNK